MDSSSTGSSSRQLLGAVVLPDGSVQFRVWAPTCRLVEVFSEDGQAFKLAREGEGYFSGVSRTLECGCRYRYRLDSGDALYPDPVSRFQPAGPHGSSQIVDPNEFRWTDQAWRGISLAGQVIYEMHVGTFTPQGTWGAATRELAELAAVGITAIEVMPVADFVGRFGWGYDGVNLFAPCHLYGTPDDFRRFIDAAHALGIGVILDVVYNHLGPDGNYLARFSPEYFTKKYTTDWGEAINFDGPHAGPVREYYLQNAAYWISEYHLDGLRIDATQNIYDDSPTHILAEMSRRTREAAGNRSIILVAENEPQETRLVRPLERGGFGLDALWNDDLHHSALVVLAGHNEAYYTDYLGTPQEFISAVKWGYLYQGQYYRWQKKRRGTPAFDLDPAAFVTFIENHDQIANSPRGIRTHLLTSPGRYRAMTALMLLAPGTPMLFQGQEFGASAPFFYFADHKPELGEMIKKGRKEFMAQFPSCHTLEMEAALADPTLVETYERCKLDFSERKKNAAVYQLHKDLLRLRREDPVFRLQQRRGVDGAVLGTEAFVLRFFAADGADRLLLVNLGSDLHLDPAPEPLLAPPLESVWKILWSSEAAVYGGCGTAPLEANDNWHIPGHAVVVVAPAKVREQKSE